MRGTVTKAPRARPCRNHSRSAHFRRALGVLLLTDAAIGAIGPGAGAQVTEPPPFRTERLGEKVLLLTETSPMENIVVALATDMGLVVVDATGSPYTAGLLREVIREAFGRADITFSDRMTLDLGDLTLELTFFGRAHSGNDLLIQIPEEVLARFPLEERFLYLKELGHTDEELADFQRGSVEASWRQLSGDGAPEPKTVTRFRTRF